ncbi:MAG: hypothetical protein B7Y59_03115 [Burkholderiales bacterium 35-55-47]|jgi:hypothetical protein|uniref:hypothetical protein n=1 Tax=Limnohabitans sp. TaxID=1907725 RepID=UPI000BC37B6F|nr:hypothetical protein [Limnohabitans sp.]OYY20095.1 MAG: hypothetical protein B7Y59_03115 [Burkholderiales bacterium 35-55-47]OYZ74295.1 MAG: hypothetical protein B7Y06_01900 [Burkholderiales bacterium 24-55-52]OZB01814.1 MAG: hypothetical protein B7X62_03105 [Burkholderiales bacterium 39-55-53]HQR86326.1 hypothetical protein [Limnohabitans sp.]HQS25757.1 hypothetical protein [Limnohabitans sp.]
MKIEIKHVLLYAIVPAVIAGLFTLVPKFYEVFFESKAELRYTYSAGPQIGVDGLQQQVTSIKISNTGKKTLTAIRIEFSVPAGVLVAATVENLSGLIVDSKKTDDKLIVTVPKIFQGESFSISTLIKTEAEKINPKILVRSDEVLGVFDESKAENSSSGGSWLSSGISAALSVLAMALGALSKFSKGTPFGFFGDRRDVIFYIALSTKCPPLIDIVRAAREEMTYMSFADILFSYGRDLDGRLQYFSIAGLQCLVDIDSEQIAEQSKRVARRNLELLIGGQLNADQLNSNVSINDALIFRDHVDSIFSRCKKLY